MHDSRSLPLEFVTTNQAAAIHDVTPSTIRSWVLRGLLAPHTNVQGANVFRLSDVDKAEMESRRRDKSKRAQSRIA